MSIFTKLNVPFLDIKAQNRSLWPELQAAVDGVTTQAQFILGPAVERFEKAFSEYIDRKYCIGMNNGTSALHLALQACDIGPGDEVITTPHTWVSTSWAISYVGARPVYVDIDPTTYNINPALIERAITSRTKAILPVHLYGQACDMDALCEIAQNRKLLLIEDAAQAHGAVYNGRKIGSFGHLACFSFYPGKNLGAFGEGGAVVTDDEKLSERIRRLRDHAQEGRHNHVELGYNTRMEGIQGAVLDVKLRHLDAWNSARNRHANRYLELLADVPGIKLPTAPKKGRHVWHLFVVLLEGIDRDNLQKQLAERGISTGVHYPTPVPFQPAYAHLGYQRGDFPLAEDVMSRCLSLPMYAELENEQIDYVSEVLHELAENIIRWPCLNMKDKTIMNLNNKKILVTGGCGLIGSTIIDQLLVTATNSQIVVIDNLSRGTLLNLESALSSGRVKLIREDIRYFDRIRPWFDGVDAVFHQAAIRITRCAQEPRECLEVLIDGTFNVLQACVEAGVQRVVAASSASVYGMADEFPTVETHHLYNNKTLYGAAKMANEGMLRSFHDMYALPYVALRYFNVYGPRMDVFGKYTEVLIRWLDCLDNGEQPTIFGNGKQTMDFVYVEDVARANILAMESVAMDEVFNVASGTETSLLDLLESLLHVTGNEHVRPAFLPERAVNPVPRRLADTSKAERLLGFRAKVGIEEGLRKLIAWRRDVLHRGQQTAYEGAQPVLAGEER